MKRSRYITVSVVLCNYLRIYCQASLETRSDFSVIQDTKVHVDDLSSYFGYSIAISNERALISAPKTSGTSNGTDQTASDKGFLKKCDLNLNQERVQCERIGPDKSTPNSGIGLSMALDGTDAKVCAPVSKLVCGKGKSVPGRCYSSNDTGKTWKHQAIRTNETSTPVDDCPTANADIIFLLDGSDSVTYRFTTVVNWTAAVARTFNVEDGSVQIGVVQYSSINVEQQ